MNPALDMLVLFGGLLFGGLRNVERPQGRLAKRWCGLTPVESTPMAQISRAIRLFPNAWSKESELAEELGPNRDHAHKQRDGCQSRRLFHENPQHRRLLGSRT